MIKLLKMKNELDFEYIEKNFGFEKEGNHIVPLNNGIVYFEDGTISYIMVNDLINKINTRINDIIKYKFSDDITHFKVFLKELNKFKGCLVYPNGEVKK